MNYKDTYTASTENPEAFWKDQADAIRWFTKPESKMGIRFGTKTAN
jgi:hypothetical protein